MKDWFEGRVVEETDPVPLAVLPWWSVAAAIVLGVIAAIGFSASMGWWFS